MNHAYVAGFIDGEGHFYMRLRHIRNGGNSIVAVLRIANTNKPVLEQIQAKYGGYISKLPLRPNCKQAYRLEIEGYTRLRSLLYAIVPHLIIKQKQALLMLDFISRDPHARYTQAEYNMIGQMRDMNFRGVKKLNHIA